MGLIRLVALACAALAVAPSAWALVRAYRCAPPLPSCVCALYPGHTPRPRPCKHPDACHPVQTAEESLAQHILLAASKMAPAEGAAKGRYASVRGLLLFPAPPHIAPAPGARAARPAWKRRGAPRVRLQSPPGSLQ